ncbi:MAG: nitroreductase [Frankia sp.]|nr:nitroreductase [Frankia sp.]
MVTQEAALTVDRAREAVTAAGLAPSLHNSQPWRWRLRQDALELSADLSRAVPVVDPDHRQLLISCGAALLNCWLSLRAAGLDVEVAELPDGPDISTGRLAVLRVVGRRPPCPTETTLAEAITRRHTDRRPFTAADLPTEVIRELRRAAEAEGCWLAWLTDPDARLELSVLLTRADWIETHDPAYQAELASWLREDPAAPDGIPRAATPVSEGPRRSEFPLRDFGGASGLPTSSAPGGPPAGAAGGAGAAAGDAGGGARLPESPEEAERRARETPVEHPSVLVIGTDADGPADRLRAGRALGRVLLAATAAGVATSPLGQAIDIEATRALVRRATGGSGHAQMILRAGYADPHTPPLPATNRRPVDDVLTIAADGPSPMARS